MRTFTVSVLAALATCTLASAATSQVLSDDFNDGVRAPLWNGGGFGTGPLVLVTNGRLEITLAPESKGILFSPLAQLGSYFIAGYTWACRLAGDYDVQVDYALLTWPPANGAFVQLEAYVNPPERHILTQRSSNAGGEQYCSHVGVTGANEGAGQCIRTSDRSGKFRITRVGSTGASYYFSNDTWTLMASGQAFTGDIPISITAGAFDAAFAKQLVVVAFDNFIVNQGTLVGCVVCADARAAVDVVQPKLSIGKLNTPLGDDTLSFQGTLTLPSPVSPALDPLANGVRLVIDDGARHVTDNNMGNVLDVTIPGGTGWAVNGRGTKWTYRNKTATPPGGIYSVVIQDKSAARPGLVKFAVKGKAGSYAVASTDLPVTTRMILAPSGGQCGDASFASCAFNASGSTLKCK